MSGAVWQSRSPSSAKPSLGLPLSPGRSPPYRDRAQTTVRRTAFVPRVSVANRVAKAKQHLRGGTLPGVQYGTTSCQASNWSLSQLSKQSGMPPSPWPKRPSQVCKPNVIQCNIYYYQTTPSYVFLSYIFSLKVSAPAAPASKNLLAPMYSLYRSVRRCSSKVVCFRWRSPSNLTWIPPCLVSYKIKNVCMGICLWE